MSDVAQALSVGSILGGRGPWTSTWSEAIGALTIKIANARKGVISPLNVNVVFHVPGNLMKPDFEGVRTGSFSKKTSLLQVQIALPETPPADIDADLKARVNEALNEAERWAQKKKIASDLTQLRRLVI